MTTELVPLPHPIPNPGDDAPAPWHESGPIDPKSADWGDAVDLVELALTGLKPSSREGYRKDLNAFAGWVGPMPTNDALWGLIRLRAGPANATVMAYVEAMGARKLAPATIRRRVAALVRAVARARRIGLTMLTIEVDLPKAEAFRDTMGPGKRGWAKILELAEAERGTPRGSRNLAVLLLLHDRALRRAEVSGLDVADFDAGRPAVNVIGKGKLQKEWLTVNARTSDAILRWLVERIGDPGGALFTCLDNAAEARGPAGRLSGQAINELVKGVAERAGLSRTVTAHALRHQAITSALDSRWDVRDVRHFSRHAKIDTVLIYDDRRKDLGGEITRDLGDEKRPRKRGGSARGN